MSIFDQSLSDFHKLCNSTFYLIVVNKFIQVILVSVGGIMVSIAAFQAVDPGSIPGRRSCFSSAHIYWEKKFWSELIGNNSSNDD